VPTVFTPTRREVLEFCAEEPIERVALEDLALRGLGRFSAVAGNGRIDALVHVGVNVLPAGRGCGVFAPLVDARQSSMILGDEQAVGELWDAARTRLPAPRADRHGQPVFVLDDPPTPGRTGLRPATPDDVGLLVPACAAAHLEELGTDPLGRDERAFRWRTRAQIDAGRSWLWEESGAILFKAEASAWTRSAVQLQQVWVDPAARGNGYAQRGLRDLCRHLLRQVASVCLFVRTENERAIHVYERIGMLRHGTYRSVLLQPVTAELSE
jgi:hypothetical protein